MFARVFWPVLVSPVHTDWAVGIAIQNAWALDERFKGEFALRDLLDSYAHATSLLDTIVDGRQDAPQLDLPHTPRTPHTPALRRQSLDPDHALVPGEGGEQGDKAGGTEGRELEGTQDASETQKLSGLLRHMAAAVTEVTKASICNISLIIDSAGCSGSSGGAGGSATAPDHSYGAPRLNQLKCAVSSRPLAPMPSGRGCDAEAASDPDLRLRRGLAGLRFLAVDTADASKRGAEGLRGSSGGGADAADQWMELAVSMRQNTSSLPDFKKRPAAAISLKVQDMLVQQQLQEQETHLLQDQPGRSLRTFSFYGKPWETAECLESTTKVRGIAGVAMRTNTAQRLAFAADHPAFDAYIDSKPGHATASLLAVPVADSLGQVRAVITLANRFSSDAPRASEAESTGNAGDAGKDLNNGRVGFDSFSLADQLAVGVLAKGFVGSLVHHEQCLALSRLHLLVRHVAEQPSFLAAVLAAQHSLASLCRATKATFFVTNVVRGECASVSAASAPSAASAASAASPGEDLAGGELRMKTKIGKGLVGLCALRRRALSFSGEEEDADHDDVGRGRGEGARCASAGEEATEDELAYGEWEGRKKAQGCCLMAIPFLVSRCVPVRARATCVRQQKSALGSAGHGNFI